MNVTPEQVQLILTGNQSFTQLGFSMMVTRLKSTYSRDKSQDNLKKCTDEINLFLQKFASIMTVDFATMSQL